MRITEITDHSNARFCTDNLREKVKKISRDFYKKGQDNRHHCPACLFPEYDYAFDKYGFHYVQCKKCSSLYIRNPISKEQQKEYRIQIEKLYQKKENEGILRKLYDKKIFDLEITLNRTFYKMQNIRVGFVESKFIDIFADLEGKFPSFHFEAFTWKPGLKYHFIVMDNLLERLPEPCKYLRSIAKFLVDDGYLYATSRLGSGIDILMLWEKSKLIPTEHLNLFSKEGIELLFRNIFNLKHISTPGVLDIRMMLESGTDNLPPFLEYLKKHRGEEIIEDFQYFLQKHLLSSYMILLAQKKRVSGQENST